jgi:WD40 repeat protein
MLAAMDSVEKEKGKFEEARSLLGNVSADSIVEGDLKRRLVSMRRLVAGLEAHDFPMDISSVESAKTQDGAPARVGKLGVKLDVAEMAVLKGTSGYLLSVRTAKNRKLSVCEFLTDPPNWKEALSEVSGVYAIASDPGGGRVLYIRTDPNQQPYYSGLCYDFARRAEDREKTASGWLKKYLLNQIQLKKDSSLLPLLCAVGPRYLGVVVSNGGPVIAYDYTADDSKKIVAETLKASSLAMDPGERCFAIGMPRNGTVFLKYVEKSLVPLPENGFFHLDHPQALVLGLTFHPDGSRLLTACDDGSVNEWVLADFRALWEVWSRRQDNEKNRVPNYLQYPNPTGPAMLFKHVRPVHCLAFSPRGRYLAVGDEDGKVLIWGIEEKTVLLRLRQSASPGPVRSLVFSPDGLFLAALGGKDSTVRVWVTEGWEAKTEDHGQDTVAPRETR